MRNKYDISDKPKQELRCSMCGGRFIASTDEEYTPKWCPFCDAESKLKEVKHGEKEIDRARDILREMAQAKGDEE